MQDCIKDIKKYLKIPIQNIRFHAILIFILFSASCFDGLGPLANEDYSDNYAKSITLSVDHNINEDSISCTIKITKADDESKVGYYALYWGDSDKGILSDSPATIKIIAPTGSDISDTINTELPVGAKYLLLYSNLSENNISHLSATCRIEDLVMKRISNINTSGNSNPADFVIYNDLLYFSAYDGTETEIWCYNANTNMITGPVTNINSSGSSSVKDLTLFNNRIYFSAYNNSTGNELYYYDGSSHLVSDYIQGTSSLYPLNLTVCDNKLFFSGKIHTDSINLSTQLVYLDTDNNYHPVIVNRDKNAYPTSLYAHNNKLFFNADASTTSDTDNRLFVYDGTVSEIEISTITNPNPNSFASYRGNLYFSALITAPYTDALWMYNGESVLQVSTIEPRSNILFVYNDLLFFSANGGFGDGYELYYYSPESIQHFDLIPGTASSYPDYIKCEYNGYLFFSAYTSDTRYELWIYRGTGLPEMITDLYPESGNSINEFIVFNNKLYFSTTSDDGEFGFGIELWVLYFK